MEAPTLSRDIRTPSTPGAWQRASDRRSRSPRPLEAAADDLDPGARGYVAGGAGTEDTMRANLDAFRRWRIVPRMLRDVVAARPAHELLGTRDARAGAARARSACSRSSTRTASSPVARAAAALGVPMVAEHGSSIRWRRSPRRAGDAPRWFQLYWPRSDELAASLVRPRRGGRLRGDRGDAGHDAARPGARATSSSAYLPFLQGDGHRATTSPTRSSARARRSRRRRTRRRAVGHFARRRSPTRR